jgi:maleate cis-trans isomerase
MPPAVIPATIRHFGVLIPSTNTTGEIEYSRLLPPQWQAHYARLATSSINKTPFSPPRDEDVDYQAKLLGTARVEAVFLLQTSASLFADGYCADVSARISTASGVPGFTSAMAIGEAMGALGVRRVALVSPYSVPVNASAKRYYEGRYGLDVVAIEGFAATDSYAIGKLGPEMARDAFARIDRPEIEAFIVPGGNFPTMASIAGWEAEFRKPVVTTNQAALWAVLQRLGSPDRMPGLGRLLE